MSNSRIRFAIEHSDMYDRSKLVKFTNSIEPYLAVKYRGVAIRPLVGSFPTLTDAITNTLTGLVQEEILDELLSSSAGFYSLGKAKNTTVTFVTSLSAGIFNQLISVIRCPEEYTELTEVIYTDDINFDVGKISIVSKEDAYDCRINSPFDFDINYVYMIVQSSREKENNGHIRHVTDYLLYLPDRAFIKVEKDAKVLARGVFDA